MLASPEADPSIYIEKPLSEVIAGNLTGKEAYDSNWGGDLKYYHIVSEAYLRCTNEKDWIIYYDNEANFLNVYFSRDFNREFNILENGDYDFRKLYRIKYTLRWAGPGSGTTNKQDFYIELDSIEGMLTYREYESKEFERQRAEREAEKDAEKLQRKNTAEAAYRTAFNTTGIDAIALYIRTYTQRDYRDYFNEDSYAEIARRIVNDRNIKFDNITMKGNPYAYEKDTIYFYRYSINVYQWMTNGILCYINDHALVIEKVPDVRSIGGIIKNAYLKYTGIRTLQFVNGKTEVIPVFNLIYAIDG
jgi:hypothetical protein